MEHKVPIDAEDSRSVKGKCRKDDCGKGPPARRPLAQISHMEVVMMR